MPGSSEADIEDKIDIKWGNKRGVGGKNRDIQFYESFIYDGVEYFLYDCVCFYSSGNLETNIGKLVKICEKPTREKIVKVVWFFRPIEIRDFLGSYKPCWNELFLASGEGKGVSNFNLVETIVGKCSVVCSSNDKRNPEPSESELKKADYFFNCTFNVGRLKIVDKFPDEIDGIKVENLFNKKKDQNISNPPHIGTSIKQLNERSRLSSKLGQVVENAAVDGHFGSGIQPVEKESKEGTAVLVDKIPASNHKSISRDKGVIKKSTVPSGSCQDEDKPDVRSNENVLRKNVVDSFPYKKRMALEENSPIRRRRDPTAEEDFDDRRRKTSREVKPEIGEAKAVKRLKTSGKMMEPWEDRLQRAEQLGTLVLLNNLDPSYTSYEVEDLVWHALNEKVEARKIEWSSTFNPYYGRALVIFRTKDAAVGAISMLSKRSLILGDGRIVTGMRGSLRDLGKQTTNFIGHLSIGRYKSQTKRLSDDVRNAVSTAHCSQTNTIEYGMALEWFELQYKTDLWWKALNEKQMKEIENVKTRLEGTASSSSQIE
ncbi:hypothetical protein L6164_004454 [Bauhinia variegata]|uniref:Uncharacterized protein n=1 Tax=Bauhinia variegata TaxID=167791 RepID=A0ACB9Q3Z0_BAUVA|nr:hypothetical protein L6164_004454 [Bauhinia variegata]